MWQELHRLAYRYLVSLGLTREDAEDLAQETMVAACLHLDGVQPGKLQAWVITVARHKFIDWLRRAGRGVSLLYLPDAEPEEAAGCPEAKALQQERRQEIMAALNRLEPTERALLVLKYNLGLKGEEIAKLLKMKPNTVKVKLYRARQRFKAEYNRILEGRR
ncbi:RNA polymerase sigma factor [Moorella sp. ACPs]|uniref:RNA polymerase sigma factor n=1 Tax=Neomoorella carbonis TaxID=3062783 RepID=UPI0032563C53